jgi:hypothetical protein
MKIDGIFLMERVRLKSYRSTAMWNFTREDKLRTWLDKECVVNDKNIAFSINGKAVSMDIVKKDYDDQIEYVLNDDERSYSLKVYMMNCTSLTEFCTQINFIQEGFVDSDERDYYKAFWNEKLDKLRENFNGSWIIEDKDLVLSVLR